MSGKKRRPTETVWIQADLITALGDYAAMLEEELGFPPEVSWQLEVGSELRERIADLYRELDVT